MRHWLRGILQDETGQGSMARLSFAGTLVFTGVMIRQHAVGVWNVPDAAYAILTTVLVGQIAWSGGNRVAAHLAPALSAVASLFGQVAMRLAGRRDET